MSMVEQQQAGAVPLSSNYHLHLRLHAEVHCIEHPIPTEELILFLLRGWHHHSQRLGHTASPLLQHLEAWLLDRVPKRQR